MKTTYSPVVEVRGNDIRDASGGLVNRRVLSQEQRLGPTMIVDHDSIVRSPQTRSASRARPGRREDPLVS